MFNKKEKRKWIFFELNIVGKNVKHIDVNQFCSTQLKGNQNTHKESAVAETTFICHF